MKFVRYKYGNLIFTGVLDGDRVIEVINFSFNESDYIYGNVIPLGEVKILQPVVPTKVVGLAYNYKDLVGYKNNYDEPLIFLKPSTSVIGPGDPIFIHKGVKTWGEVEIAVVIKKECKNVCIDNVQDYVFGYTIGNDVTMENIYGRDHHLGRSKSLDTFCPLGEFIETEFDSNNKLLTNHINDKLFQSGNSGDRILNEFESIVLISKFITLYPGDVVLTGTPANAMNSLITDGDEISLKIESLGQLVNPVKFIS